MATHASSMKQQPAILVNSCTGKMGQSVGEAALRAGLELVPYSLCSAADAASKESVQVGGKSVQLVGPGPERTALIQQLQQRYPHMITVDYTVPDVIHDMVNLYVQHRMPFVMGTTGGDRQRIAAEVQTSGLHAVIAPNMGKQIVAFQVRLGGFPRGDNRNLDEIEGHCYRGLWDTATPGCEDRRVINGGSHGGAGKAGLDLLHRFCPTVMGPARQ